MYERFTDRARRVMHLANEEARRLNHEYVGTEHILLGLVGEGSGVAANVLKNLDIDLDRVRREVARIVQAGPDSAAMSRMPQTPWAKKVIEYSIEEAGRLGHDYVGTEHLLLGLVRQEQGLAAQVLMGLGLKLDDLRREVLALLGQTLPPFERQAAPGAKVKTPVLDAFGQDLVAQARQGSLDPVVGREEPIARLADVLGCLARRNPLLVGEAGVGKKAVVRGLARAIAGGTAPDPLRDHRVVVVDMNRLAGARPRGSWRERFLAVLAEARAARSVVLVLHDLRPLVSRRVGDDVAGLVDWALARGDLQVIGTATPGEYRRLRVAGGVIRRHFRPVRVSPLSAGQAAEVLQAHRACLEEGHGVQITDDAVAAAAELAGLYLPDEPLPGAALDLLDEAGSRVWLGWASRPPEVRAIDEQIARLEAAKEAAVAAGDFKRAAAVRAEAELCRARKKEALQAGRPTGAVAVVDAAAVVDTLGRITGLCPETIRDREGVPAPGRSGGGRGSVPGRVPREDQGRQEGEN